MGEKKCDGKDIVQVGPRLPNGSFLGVRHLPDHTREFGEVRSLEDGKPLDDRALLLSEREGEDNVLDVVSGGTISNLKEGTLPGGGQVATPAYREGYERTFGSNRKLDSSLN